MPSLRISFNYVGTRAPIAVNYRSRILEGKRPQLGPVEPRKGNGDIGATGNMELREMAESGGLSWEAQEVFQKISRLAGRFRCSDDSIEYEGW